VVAAHAALLREDTPCCCPMAPVTVMRSHR